MDKAEDSYYCSECKAYRLKVLKFGGSSIGTAASLANIGKIVAASTETSRTIIVSSAVRGVTDLLLEFTDANVEPSSEPGQLMQSLTDIHVDLARQVLGESRLDRYRTRVKEILEGMEDLLHEYGGSPEPRIRDAIASFGERLSTPLVAHVIHGTGVDAAPVDADDLLLTDANYGNARIHLTPTLLAIRRWYTSLDDTIVPVVTGFVGSAPDGSTTTLGRGGSDLTAAIIARALHASIFERWTDVDGLYSAHPESLDAKHLPTVAFSEAIRVNGSGKYGMHKGSLEPLTGAEIPVLVGSTGNPEGRKTIILPERPWLTVTRCRCEIAI